MKKFSLLVVSALVCGLSFTGCSSKLDPNDPTSIRKWMDKQNMKFLPGTFVNAVVKGDTATATLLLKAGLTVDGTDARGNSALAICANKNQADLVKYLLDNGADPSLKSSKGVTPLVDAASLGNKETVALLLAKIKESDPELITATDAMMMAARQGFAEIVQVMVEGGTPKDFKSNEGWTALAWASKGGHVAVVEFLISAGADVNAGDKDGYTPLDWANNEGYPKVSQLLRKAGGKTTVK